MYDSMMCYRPLFVIILLHAGSILSFCIDCSAREGIISWTGDLCGMGRLLYLHLAR